MLKSLLRKKSLEQYSQEIKNCQLKRVHGKLSLTAIGIGAIIGGGIMTLTGIAAHEYAGPALVISFLIAGVCCAFTSLCYAEFASIIPVEGSAYAYSYSTMGEIFAWFVGWNLMLEYMMGATSVAVSWSGYFENFLHLFNIHLPLYLTNDPITAQLKVEQMIAAGLTPPTYSFAFNLPAFLLVWLVTLVAIRGAQTTQWVNNFLVVLKIAIVLFVIFVGAYFVDVNNWTPFIPERIIDAHGASHFGIQGVITAATIVFFAFLGFDATSAHAGEAINPKRDIPFAIVASLLICTLLYILVSFVLTGMERYDHLDLKAPVAYAFQHHGIKWAVVLIDIAAVFGLVSVVLVLISGQVRIIYNMAKDGLLPEKLFGQVHKKYKTPYRGTLLVGLLVSLVAALTPIQKISEMCSMGTLFAFTMICLAVWILRITSPDIPRGYKTPFLPLISFLGISTNVFLMTQVRSETTYAFFIWGFIGLIVYMTYSFRHAHLNKKH